MKKIVQKDHEKLQKRLPGKDSQKLCDKMKRITSIPIGAAVV
jgi:hypothetical protein